MWVNVSTAFVRLSYAGSRVVALCGAARVCGALNFGAFSFRWFIYVFVRLCFGATQFAFAFMGSLSFFSSLIFFDLSSWVWETVCGACVCVAGLRGRGPWWVRALGGRELGVTVFSVLDIFGPINQILLGGTDVRKNCFHWLTSVRCDWLQFRQGLGGSRLSRGSVRAESSPQRGRGG